MLISDNDLRRDVCYVQDIDYLWYDLRFYLKEQKNDLCAATLYICIFDNFTYIIIDVIFYIEIQFILSNTY